MEFLEKVEQSGKWPQQACTTMFLIPKNVTSERPIALDADVGTLVGSAEGIRRGETAAEVPRGLGRHGWPKSRSSTNSVRSSDGDGKI